MIINIDFTAILITIYLWLYCTAALCGAIAQIRNSVTPRYFSNKERMMSIFGNIIDIGAFYSLYVGHYITATNVISLYYFVVFVIIYAVTEIILSLRHYENDMHKYSMIEVYFLMICNMLITFWMASLWLLKI